MIFSQAFRTWAGKSKERLEKMAKRQILILALAIAPFFAVLTEAKEQKQSQILLDLERGKISRIEALVNLGYRVFAPERLPARYRGDLEVPLKCGTDLVAEIRKNLSKMSGEDRHLFESYLQRPNLPHSYVSPEGLFRLHYTLGGYDGVPFGDEDSSGVPDFIERAGEYLDYCYHFEVDTLGYQKPPWDYGVDGDEIDVYFRNIGAYGYTDFDRQIPDTPYNDWTSYITMDNDFKGSEFYAQGLDGLRVTCAHELFHVIQLGYNYRDEDLFFFEMSSTWMEDRVYDDVNDYVHYIRYYLNHVDWPISLSNGFREYGASIFLKFIQEDFGDGVIRRAWEHIRQHHSMFSMNDALEEKGSSLAEAFVTFAIWNYFTGNRSNDFKFYKEANSYPEVQVNRELTFQSDTTIVDSTYALSAKYFDLSPMQSGYFRLRQNHPRPEIWQTGTIIKQATGYFVNTMDGASEGNLDYISGFQNIVLVAANGYIPARLGQSLYDYRQMRFEYLVQRQTMQGSLLVFPDPYRPGKNHLLSVRVRLPKTGHYRCLLFSENGRRIREIPLRLFPEGEALVQIPWDGTDDRGNPVPSGVYLCVIAAEDVRIVAKVAVVR